METSITQTNTQLILTPRRLLIISIVLIISLLGNVILLYKLFNSPGSKPTTNQSDNLHIESVNNDTAVLASTYHQGKQLSLRLNQSNKIDIYYGEELKISTEFDNNYVPEIVQHDSTSTDILVSFTPDGIGGYILFTGYIELHKIEPYNNWAFKRVGNPGTFFTDIKSGKAVGIELGNPQGNKPTPLELAIIDLKTLQRTAAQINVLYRQAGEAKISIDGNKVAYVAAVGNPDNESSAVFVYDIDNDITKMYLPEAEGLYEIHGWTFDSPYQVEYSLPRKSFPVH